MQYQVIITPSAKADIFETNAWLLENYSHVAEKWLWETSQKITSLSKLPERCPVSPESEAFDVVVRHLIYGKKPHTYRILFSIQEEKVYILRVRSTKQKSLLEE
ncbi:MAG: type II toxin-antitoxin system RelE/ParE family toxin [Acidobacteriota bacterium]